MFVLSRFAETPYADMVRSWEAFDGRTRPFSLPVVTMMALLQHLDEELDAGYSTLHVVTLHVKAVHTMLSLLSPTDDADIKGFLQMREDAYEAMGAGSFSYDKDLPKIREAILGMQGWGSGYRTMVWAMAMLCAANFFRCSDVTEFCPLVEDITMGPVDSDGVPKFLAFIQRARKGHREIRTRLLMWRNYLDGVYCPVRVVLEWLMASGLRQGPLFVMQRGDRFPAGVTAKAESTSKNKELLVWYSEDGRKVSLTTHWWQQRCRKFFDVAGFQECSSHSFRKSAVKWAARCHAQYHEVLNSGGWAVGSRHPMQYYEAGRVERDVYERCDEDPVWTFWVYQPHSREDLKG